MLVLSWIVVMVGWSSRAIFEAMGTATISQSEAIGAATLAHDEEIGAAISVTFAIPGAEIADTVTAGVDTLAMLDARG